MAPTIEYEPSIAPVQFTKIWRERIESKLQRQSSNPRSPLSPALLQDKDCPFEYDDEYLQYGDIGKSIGENRYPRTTSDYDADLPSLARSEIDTLRHDTPQLTMALIGGSLQDLDAQMQNMESQMGKQDQVNQDLQRQMKALVESFRKLEQKLATQQAKLDAFGRDG